MYGEILLIRAADLIFLRKDRSANLNSDVRNALSEDPSNEVVLSDQPFTEIRRQTGQCLMTWAVRSGGPYIHDALGGLQRVTTPTADPLQAYCQPTLFWRHESNGEYNERG